MYFSSLYDRKITRKKREKNITAKRKGHEALNVVSFSLREYISTRKTKRPCYSHDPLVSCITLKWAFFPFGRSSGSTNNRRVHLVSAFSESSTTKIPCCLHFDILPIKIPTHSDTNAISTYDKISIYYYPLLQDVVLLSSISMVTFPFV